MCSYNNLLTREKQNFHVAFLGRFIPLTGAGFFCQILLSGSPYYYVVDNNENNFNSFQVQSRA